MADVIALFPLTHVLVPGMPLPLHIFEPRYRQLLVDVAEDGGHGSFGVVALRRGSEVANRDDDGTPDVMTVGTLAEILEVEPYDNGASDLLAVGSRRFRVRRLVTAGTPYLRGEVDWLDERDGAITPQHVTITRRLARDYAELVEVLTGRAPDPDLPRDPNLLSYHVAGHLPLTAADRQALLEEPTAADRLLRAIALLRRETSLLQATGTIAVSPSALRLGTHAN